MSRSKRLNGVANAAPTIGYPLWGDRHYRFEVALTQKPQIP